MGLPFINVYPSKLEFSLGTVMAVYRNLRENYEFRLRFDEAGQFFFKEMELKRKYREEEINLKEERFGTHQHRIPLISSLTSQLRRRCRRRW
jgi:hypothetical protein